MEPQLKQNREKEETSIIIQIAPLYFYSDV